MSSYPEIVEYTGEVNKLDPLPLREGLGVGCAAVRTGGCGTPPPDPLPQGEGEISFCPRPA